MRLRLGVSAICFCLVSSFLFLSSSPPSNSEPDSQTSLYQWGYILADNTRGPSMVGSGNFGLGFADLNGDGYKDIASGRYFYRNPGGNMTSTPWPRVTLPTNPANGRSVDAFLLFDAEGTGTLDDIIAEDLPNVLWLKANDAQGNSWTPTVIAQIPLTSHGNGRTVKLAHIIPTNTRPDILLSGGDGIYLMQIPANLNSSWPIMKITTSNNGEQKAIGVGDIDRDGDLDISVAVGAERLEVDWWSNPGDGSANWVKRVIGNTNATVKMIEVADINGDGRLDVIVTEEARPAAVYWFEAPVDPVNGTWTRHTVASGLEELDSMSGNDMNGDGKPDIIVGEIFGLKRVIIFENVNNGASWNTQEVDNGKESHNGAITVDLNNDGQLDIVSIAYFDYSKMHIWRNDGYVRANIKVMVQGSYDSTGDSLRTNLASLLPLTQPYNTAPWNYAGTEQVTSIPPGVVDWVLVELRTGTAANTKVATRAAFIKSNGIVIDLDGLSSVVFQGVTSGSYYIVVRHRNHLAIMSANPIALSQTAGLYDFSTAQSTAFGNSAMTQLESNVFGMIAGDATRSSTINLADANLLLAALDSTGYNHNDINLSGIVTSADVNMVFGNLNKATQVP